MDDRLRQSGRETGDVLVELVARAKEAAHDGTSRRAFFARTAKLAGATALGAAGAALLQPIAIASATSTGPTDTTATILNIAATAEALATTVYYHALISKNLPDVNNDANRNYFQAALIQEYVHLEILRSLGAKEYTDKFFFPASMFYDEKTFFATISTLEDYFISAYMAAALEFSGAVSSGITAANTTALGLSVQILGVECEHRALIRVAANQNPANNVLIESELLTSVGAATTPLMPFLSGGGGFTTTFGLPKRSDVNTVAEPFGFSSFPAYTIV